MTGLRKSEREIAILDQANTIVQRLLGELGERVAPGVSTMDLDQWAEQQILAADGKPAFKGYPHRGDGRDFPGTLCTSVNDEVVHGVPSPQVVLAAGDTISIDVGVLYQGYYGDGARTFAVGPIDPQVQKLLDVTREALEIGMQAARVGNRVSDIGHQVQRHVEAQGFSVVREFVGHGIGAHLHEDPQVPNYGDPGQGQRLCDGMVLAIEPMVNAGGPDVVLSADDGWTARTRDGSRSAHFECCVAITAEGPRVLGRQSSALAARRTG